MLVRISDKYFRENRGFVEMLDATDIRKQVSRSYLPVAVELSRGDNAFFVPLRKNINFGDKRMGYSVPSAAKPNAGFDFRKALVVNNTECILEPKLAGITPAQLKKIESDKTRIDYLFANYVNHYIKAVRKNREKIEKLYIFTTLHNFHAELGLLDSSP